MPGETVELTKKALHRLKIVEAIIENRLTQSDAAGQLGVTTRRVKRLVATYRREGAVGLVSRRRGRPSNRRLKEPLRERIRVLLSEQYPDFGPTLACEKLRELHDIEVSVETLRQLQIEWGLWRAKRRKGARAFQLRKRRDRIGELVQVDGSPHDWFEGRAPRCTLIVLIDDATGRLLGLRFVPAETTVAYLLVLRTCLERFCCLSEYLPAKFPSHSAPECLSLATLPTPGGQAWASGTVRSASVSGRALRGVLGAPAHGELRGVVVGGGRQRPPREV